LDSESNKRSFLRSFFRTIVIIAITAIVTYRIAVENTTTRLLSKVDSEYMKTKMALVKTKLDETYLHDLNEEDMIEGAIKGYVEGVGDKWTEYLPEEEFESLMEKTTGNYVGIGVYMAYSVDANGVIIVGVIEGSPAEEAGIKIGDIISKVDDIDYRGSKSDNVSAAIKGQPFTNVKITVIRNGEEIDINVTRMSIKVKTVVSKMLDDNIAYIQISSFDEGTSDEFKKHYNDLKNKNPKGLIIDLRNNGGGIVTEALSIIDMMTAKGKTMLITTGKNNKEKIDKSKNNPIVDIPVVILINEKSASASEILASSVRDNCGYKIVGTNSYGKGVIQSIFGFKDGTGIKITTDEYFSPNHNVINGVGIKPDIEVEQEAEWKSYSVVPYEHDIQLQKAEEQLK